MAQAQAGSTDPLLIARVARLRDDPAWAEFHARYDPFIVDCCARSGLDPESCDELRQRIWVALARRMPSYQYDPSGSFRGWLTRLCQRRAIDMYRERNHPRQVPLDDCLLLARSDEDDADGDEDETLILLREALAVQEAVRAGVKPVRWEVFWRVVIEGESMSAVAAALRMKYATVYASVNHVARKLREEGRHRREGPG